MGKAEFLLDCHLRCWIWKMQGAMCWGIVLSVADLLQVCGYAVKVAEMIEPGHKLFDEEGAAVSVFKGLELVLNNKGKNNQCAKMLHLANDFLLRAVKPDLEKKEHKQVVVGLSLLVDLAIDFLSGK